MAKKYQKSVFFHRQNSQKSEKNPAKTAKNCRKIQSKTFLKGGADRSGPILKGRAAGSSGPPIFRGGWAVAAVIGAALSSLKVVAGCCLFAAGGWCRAGRRCSAGRRCRAGSVAAGRWLSILYGVGCHRLRWAALSILYSSKVGRGVDHRAGRCRCSRAAGLSCCKVRRVVIGAAPISQGGGPGVIRGHRVGAAAQCAPDPCRAPVAAAQFQPQTFQRHGCSRSRSRSSGRRRTHKRQGGPCGLSCLLCLSDLVLFAVAVVICCGRLEAVAGHSLPCGGQNIALYAPAGLLICCGFYLAVFFRFHSYSYRFQCCQIPRISGALCVCAHTIPPFFLIISYLSESCKHEHIAQYFPALICAKGRKARNSCYHD